MMHNQAHQDCKSCDTMNSFSKCKPKHTEPQKIFLECGNGTGNRVFTSSGNMPFQIAHVTIDTTCLDRPKVLIKFSSMIKLEIVSTGLGLAKLKYELFSVDQKGQLSLLETWLGDYSSQNTTFDAREDSFNFIFCDCITSPDCYEYFITISPIEILNTKVTVGNGRMAALAQSLHGLSENECQLKVKNDCDNNTIKHPKPRDIQLGCSQGNGSTTFKAIGFPAGTPTVLSPPAEIASVEIDIKNSCKSKVLVEFSSLVNIDANNTGYNLQFELFRVCHDREPVSLGIWMISRENTFSYSQVFSFIFTESLACLGCYKYFVRVTPIEIDIMLAGFFTSEVTVDNAKMTAFVQSSSKCLNSGDYKSIDEKSNIIDYAPQRNMCKKAILECGQEIGSRTFTESSNEKFQIANVMIDTTCLCKPIVNIEFSSVLDTETGVNLLRYELFRVRNNDSPVLLGVWDLNSSFEIQKETKTIDFTFCECQKCPGCYVYFVTVTPYFIFNNGPTISNAKMAALAQDG